MKPMVFVGPTLSGDAVLSGGAFRFLPPAGMGDVYRAARKRPPAIGLIDGVFETGPAVWHKEILWALSHGVPVFGAASMGALRAAECAPFGMIGVGVIFERFRSGACEDDDEVAVMHAPKELGYRPLTEALADIRATLTRARRTRIIDARTCETLIRMAAAAFFKDRTWASLLSSASRAGFAKADLARLKRWLPRNRVEQKRADALAMLGAMRAYLATNAPPAQPKFTFERTTHWSLVAGGR